MELQEKLEKVAELLDQDLTSVRPDVDLDTIGWDSMGMLGAIALAKTNGKTITGAQIREFKTVQDILDAAF